MMPTYEFTHPKTGKTIEVSGSSPPDEATLDQIFAETAGKPETIPYDATEAARRRQAFINQEDNSLAGKARRGWQKFTAPTAPAQGALDMTTRVIPESALKLVPRVAEGTYAAIKGQTDPMIKAFTTEWNNPQYSPGDEMQKNAMDTLKGLGTAMGAGVGFSQDGNGGVTWSPHNAYDAWTTDPAGTALGLMGAKAAVKGAGKASGTLLEQVSNLGIRGVDAIAPGALPDTYAPAKSALKPTGTTKRALANNQKAVETFVRRNDRVDKAGGTLDAVNADLLDLGEQVGEIASGNVGRQRVPFASVARAIAPYRENLLNRPVSQTARVENLDQIVNNLKNSSYYDAGSQSLSLQGVQKLKQNIWKDLQDRTFQMDQPGFAKANAWELGTQMANIVADYIPEARGINAQFGELANLQRVMSQSVNRIQKYNMVPLHKLIGLAMATNGGPMAKLKAAAGVMAMVADSPGFKSWYSNKLYRARGVKPTTTEVTTGIEDLKNQLAQDFNPEVLPGRQSSQMDVIPGSEATGLEQGGWHPPVAIRRNQTVMNPEVLPPQGSNVGDRIKANVGMSMEDGLSVPTTPTNPTGRYRANPEIIPGRQSSQMDIIPGREEPKVPYQTRVTTELGDLMRKHGVFWDEIEQSMGRTLDISNPLDLALALNHMRRYSVPPSADPLGIRQ